MIFFWYLHSRAVINKGEHVISKVSYMFIKMLSQIYWIWKDHTINVVYQPNWSTHLIYASSNFLHSFISHWYWGFFSLCIITYFYFILFYFILFYFILFYFILFYFILFFIFLFFLLSYFLMWSLCFVYGLVCYRKSLTGTNMIVKTSDIRVSYI